MSLIYLWRPRAAPPDEAARRFRAALGRQAALLAQLLGEHLAPRVHQVAGTWVGQITVPSGVGGWQPWQCDAGRGVVWAGVCEEWLGRQPSAAALDDLVRLLRERPEQTAGWQGRWAACAWDEAAGSVTLTTSAEDGPSLWRAEGPRGWAAGSRAAPLLELVGHPVEVDPLAAGVFVSLGYLAGQGALLRHAERIPSRSHIAVTPGDLRGRRTAALPEWLALGQSRTAPEVAREQAEHLVGRVARQLEYSQRPQLLLTGGRDSRCIAAALVAAGYRGSARTSGAAGSPDVRIAALAAGALGLPHQHEPPAAGPSPVRALLDAPERLRLWCALGEGMETVRHALAYRAFFTGQAPFPAAREQVFHGLHGLAGEPLRQRAATPADAPLNPTAAREAILSHIPPQLRASAGVAQAIEESIAALDAELGQRRPAAGHWFTLFYWQRRALQWGADAMAVKDIIAWHWTPLLDGQLARAHLSTTGQTGKQLLEQITVAIAPRLRGVPYDKRPDAPLAALRRGAKQALAELRRRGIPLPGGRRSHTPADADLLALWDRVFFQDGGSFWPALIEEADLRGAIRAKPGSELLWNLATVELAAQALAQKGEEERGTRNTEAGVKGGKVEPAG